MSGDGLISVRLPRSLMAAFEASASRAGMDVHGAARQLIRHLGEQSDDELTSLPDPQKETDNPRISLYVGRPQIEILAAASKRTQLSMSHILRRLVYGQVVAGSFWLGEAQTIQRGPQAVGDSELIAVVFVMLAIAAIGALILYRWGRNRKRKQLIRGQKPKADRTETQREENPQ